MLKKVILIVLLLLVVTGCENIVETPINKIQYFLGKYQRLDKDTMIELDNMINRNYKLPKKGKDEYKRIFERQYQNLSYKIKEEETDYTSSVIITKIKYEIIFNLYKKNGKWKIKELSNEDFLKIHGLY